MTTSNKLPRDFEIFVLTGQSDVYNDNTFHKIFDKVYSKGKNEDVDRLFKDVQKAAEHQSETQLRKEHYRVFEVCTERYIGLRAQKDIFALLNKKDLFDIDNYFTTIRKVVEDLFIAFNKYKLLPGEFVYPRLALNASSRFLSGKEEKGIKLPPESYLPEHISQCLKNILYITQNASHSLAIDKYTKEIRSPYLWKSVLYQLLEVIIWFKFYIDNNPRQESWIASDSSASNSAQYKRGKVIQFNHQKGFAFLEPSEGGENIYIPKYLVSQNSLSNGKIITVVVEEYKDKLTGNIKYKAKYVTS